MKFVTKIFLLLVLAGIIGYSFLTMPDHSENIVVADSDSSVHPVPNVTDSLEFRLYIPDTFSFCGEEVPLHDFTVREALEEELLISNYWFSLIIKHIKRSGRWFPVIEDILREEGVPDDMKYLSVALSGLGIYSSSRNAGFWRLNKDIAYDSGLRINKDVDERHNIEKATRAICSFMKDARKRLGNWTLAMLAYREGIDELEEKLEKQKVATVYNLYLNEWDESFLYKVITIKMVMEQPERYDIYVTDNEKYLPLHVTQEDAKYDLISFSKRYGITYKMLRVYNPWLKRYTLSGNNYKLTVPAEN